MGLSELKAERHVLLCQKNANEAEICDINARIGRAKGEYANSGGRMPRKEWSKILDRRQALIVENKRVDTALANNKARTAEVLREIPETFSDELLLRAAVSAERMKRLRGVLDEIASGAKSPEAAVVQAVIEIEASLARRAEQAS